MKFYNLIIKFRFWLGLLAIALAILVTFQAGFWSAFILYLIGVIALFTHFFIGPLRLIQEPMEQGNIEEVQKIIKTIWYPNLLYKPIRSAYFTLQGNLAMMNKDFDSAEKHLKKSSALGSALPEGEGSNKLQLGMMALQKGDMKQGESYIRAAIRAGLMDKESEAVAFLSMSQIFMNKREFRAAKDFFRKAKECKPTTKETVEHLKIMEKNLSRVQ